MCQASQRLGIKEHSLNTCPMQPMIINLPKHSIKNITELSTVISTVSEAAISFRKCLKKWKKCFWRSKCKQMAKWMKMDEVSERGKTRRQRIAFRSIRALHTTGASTLYLLNFRSNKMKNCESKPIDPRWERIRNWAAGITKWAKTFGMVACTRQV